MHGQTNIKCYSCLLMFTARHNCTAITVSFLIRLSTNNYEILECKNFVFLLSNSSSIIIKLF